MYPLQAARAYLQFTSVMFLGTVLSESVTIEMVGMCRVNVMRH